MQRPAPPLSVTSYVLHIQHLESCPHAWAGADALLPTGCCCRRRYRRPPVVGHSCALLDSCVSTRLTECFQMQRIACNEAGCIELIPKDTCIESLPTSSSAIASALSIAVYLQQASATHRRSASGNAAAFCSRQQQGCRRGAPQALQPPAEIGDSGFRSPGRCRRQQQRLPLCRRQLRLARRGAAAGRRAAVGTAAAAGRP